MGKTILFFAAQYLPTAGGVERYTYNLASRLIARGHKVVVVTSWLPDAPEYEVDPIGIEVIRVPSWRLMGGRLPVIKPGRHLKKIWDRQIDYCVINTYFYPLSLYACFAAKFRKIPTIVINHGSAWLMTGNKVLELMGKVYEHMAARLAYLGCKRFYGVSKISERWMDTFSVPTQGVITNAIDPEELDAVRDKDVDWRQELGLPSDAKLIAFVGRMIPEKGVIPLIASMQAIRRQVPQAALLLAGNGPLFDKYQAEETEGVFLLGVQPYGKILALLGQAQVFCLPSRSEGFACTVLEAAAMGCPIVTTHTGGSPDLIVDPRYGILIPDALEDTIAQACVAALSDEKWRGEAVQLARKKVMENFTWEHSVGQLLDAFGLQ